MTQDITLKTMMNSVRHDLSLVSVESVREAECILCHYVSCDRTDLFAYPDKVLTSLQLSQIQDCVKRRSTGEPLAYILGAVSFWTMRLTVSPMTLIPRSDTECLIEWVLQQRSSDTDLLVADLGTGSGAIAIALSIERSQWRVHATDCCAGALRVARDNAKRYATEALSFFEGEWCAALPGKDYDMIVSNPPYIAANDAHLTELVYEPRSALVALEDGLSDIRLIVRQAREYLQRGGVLVIEHGYQQGEAVRTCFLEWGYTEVVTHHDLNGVPRFCTGVWRSDDR